MNTTFATNKDPHAALIHSLVFLLPGLTLISTFGVGLCSFAFLLLALLTRRAGWAAAQRHLSEIRGVLIAFGLSFGFALAGFALRHDVHLRALEKPSRTLAAVTVLLAVLACRPGRKTLWAGLVAGAVAGAAFSIYQRWGMGLERPGGLINSITYGDIVLCMGLMCLAGTIDFKGRQILWPVLGCVAGLAGSVATGTRGGWLAIVVGAVLFLKYGQVLRGRQRRGVAAAVLGLLLLSFVIPQTGARLRLEQGISDVEEYFNGGSSYSNVGVRFELWKAAGLLIERHPWAGASAPRVKAELAELAAAGKIDPFVLKIEHFHNDIMQALVYGGVAGLLAWGATLLAPALFFWRRLRRPDGASNAQIATALAGLMLVSGYFCFGLTEVIFWSVRSTMFYALMLFLLIGMCLNTGPLQTPSSTQSGAA
ncbi:O-antigen ligase family protein [Oxalobacteraceae bacterium]|nr:O-antigen ligase family protein [Oxalobacteraceae bacterium]